MKRSMEITAETDEQSQVVPALYRALDQADKAIAENNRPLLRHATDCTLWLLERCEDQDVVAAAVDRIVLQIRRLPQSDELHALLARIDALRGPVGHA